MWLLSWRTFDSFHKKHNKLRSPQFDWQHGVFGTHHDYTVSVNSFGHSNHPVRLWHHHSPCCHFLFVLRGVSCVFVLWLGSDTQIITSSLKTSASVSTNSWTVSWRLTLLLTWGQLTRDDSYCWTVDMIPVNIVLFAETFYCGDADIAAPQCYSSSKASFNSF